ncbi:hypothetical protein [Ruminococcus sp.]|uniref:hypothetical protein n=1 Tax=Ruminococcus sp. TaxID=41978 RepID=UPI0025F06305|nr:hypothetical protein [Ruminococcus sp.]
MEKIVGVKVPELGILNGRDCIFIDSVTHNDSGNLEFKGDINGSLAEINKNNNLIPYILTFHRVIACFSCELDTYENIGMYYHSDYTDFNIVENSKWLSTILIREDFDKSIYKHYQLFTYDYVYNIIAESFDICYDMYN